MEFLKELYGSSLGLTSNTPRMIVVHCTDVSYRNKYDQFKSVNEYHRDIRKFYESEIYRGVFIGYHKLITGGKIYTCKGDYEVGCHCNQGFDGINVFPPGTEGKLSVNFQSLSVAVGFDGDIEDIDIKDKAMLRDTIFEWQDKYGIPNERVYFHRKFAKDKTCPGNLITEKWLKDLLTRPVTTVIPPKPIEKTCLAQDVEIIELKKQLEKRESIISKIINFLWSS